MSARSPPAYGQSLTSPDALHVVVQEPLHRLPTMARDRYTLAAYILDRDRYPDRRLRMGAGYEQEI